MLPKIQVFDFITINWYFLFIYLSFFISALFLLYYKNKNFKINFSREEKILAVFTFYILGIWGGKLFGGIENYLVYLNKEGYAFFDVYTDIIAQERGRWYGSLFLNLFFGCFLFFIWERQKVLRFFDLIMLSVCLGVSIGKIGCFLDGHYGCYGIPTNLPWGVTFPYGSGATEAPVHPIQLYDSIFHFLLWLSLIKVDGVKAGVIGSVFIIITSFYNFFIEFIRTSDKIISVLSFAQVTYFILFIVSILFLFKILSFGGKTNVKRSVENFKDQQVLQ